MLQDVHWTFGMGYFPTYAIGNFYNAMYYNEMKKALDIAEEYGVMVSMCLFSHNLMEPNQWGLYDEKLDITANELLFEDAGTKAFIDNVLIPVVKAIGNHKALMTWEVFNEPEGMTSVGWTTKKLDKAVLQKFTNKVAVERRTAKDMLVLQVLRQVDTVVLTDILHSLRRQQTGMKTDSHRF